MQDKKELKPFKYQVSLNLYALTTIEAYDEEDAREKAGYLTNKEVIDILIAELNSSGIDIGTIERIGDD